MVASWSLPPSPPVNGPMSPLPALLVLSRFNYAPYLPPPLSFHTRLSKMRPPATHDLQAPCNP